LLQNFDSKSKFLYIHGMNDEDEMQIDQDGLEPENFSDGEDDLEDAEERAESRIAKLRKELEHAKKEKQENLDGWQRAKADYVNALKRFEDEKKSAVELGTLKAAIAFLPAIDSLERAKGAGELPEGFAGIVKQLEGAADKLGLTQFGKVGEKFDPMLHEALGQDAADSAEKDDTITAILESGWMLGEHVVRPAKVRVAHFA
jgi:molecular chaperone GrpE